MLVQCWQLTVTNTFHFPSNIYISILFILFQYYFKDQTVIIVLVLANSDNADTLLILKDRMYLICFKFLEKK